jgi:hypothetical protein
MEFFEGVEAGFVVGVVLEFGGKSAEELDGFGLSEAGGIIPLEKRDDDYRRSRV